MHEHLSAKAARAWVASWRLQPFPPNGRASSRHVPALIKEQAADAPGPYWVASRAIAAVNAASSHVPSADMALRRAQLANRCTRSTLQDRELQAHVGRARPLARRAQYCPDRASFRICFSSVSPQKEPSSAVRSRFKFVQALSLDPFHAAATCSTLLPVPRQILPTLSP
jgi:hypothetical protein